MDLQRAAYVYCVNLDEFVHIQILTIPSLQSRQLIFPTPLINSSPSLLPRSPIRHHSPSAWDTIRLLRVPWTARRSNQSILKEISWIFLGRTDVEAETPILWPPDVKSWLIGKDPDAGKIKAGGEGDERGWDYWMASPTQWTWVWASLGSWWWTGKPGVLQSMGLQRVRLDWVIDLNWLNWTEPLLQRSWIQHCSLKAIGFNFIYTPIS